MHLAIALPIYRFILPPAQPHEPPPVDASGRQGLSRTARMAVLVFALVMVAEGLVASIMSVHLVTILRERGLTLAAAIALGAFVGPAQVSARFGESLFGTRFHPSLTMVVAVGAIGVGVALLQILPASAAAVALVAYGAGIGLVSIARGALPLYLFGPLEAPVINGRLARLFAVVQAIAPSLGALMISRLGGGATLWVLSGVAALSLVAAIALRRIAVRLNAADS